jgi:hypothetical protein
VHAVVEMDDTKRHVFQRKELLELRSQSWIAN